MDNDTQNKLRAFFPENELEWRVQQCGTYEDAKTKETKPWVRVLCYVKARAIENRLDEVFGWDGWQNEIRFTENDIIARLGVKSANGWVWKENGAEKTDIEAFKGGISGAMKRVASSGYGIGRYLYDLEATYAICSFEKSKECQNLAKTKEGKKIYWQTPRLPQDFLPRKEEK